VHALAFHRTKLEGCPPDSQLPYSPNLTPATPLGTFCIQIDKRCLVGSASKWAARRKMPEGVTPYKIDAALCPEFRVKYKLTI
jgi:hypothetical protein